MSTPLEILADKVRAHVVGGDIIAVIKGVHTVLGVVNLDQVILNDTGRAVFKAASETVSEPRRGRRRSEEAAEGVAPAEQTLDVTDGVQATEQIG